MSTVGSLEGFFTLSDSEQIKCQPRRLENRRFPGMYYEKTREMHIGSVVDSSWIVISESSL